MGLKNFILLCTIVCFIGVEGQTFEGSLRNTRQRIPVSYLDNVEDAYVAGNTKRPIYIEGGNQWKPLYNIPSLTRSHHSSKYRSKPNIFSSKYQQSNIVNPSEYFPKTYYRPSTATFIANQTLLVADSSESVIKPSLSYKKPKYQTIIPKQHYKNQASYEVHEESEEMPDYEIQNQFRFPLPKSGHATNKPSLYSEMVAQKSIKPIQYIETVGSDKHYHHVHYHDNMEDALKASATKSQGRNYRGYPTSSTRKYY